MTVAFSDREGLEQHYADAHEGEACGQALDNCCFLLANWLMKA